MRQPWTEARNALLRELVEQRKPDTASDWAVIGTQLQTSGKACGIQWSRLKRDIKDTSGKDSSSDVSVSPLISDLTTEPLTEAQALDLFKVDTAKWEVARLSHNTWQQGSLGPEGEPLTRNLYQTTLHLKRREGADLVALTDRLLASLVRPPVPAPRIRTVKADYLLELDPVDLHFGKLGWDAETESDNYDIGIAARDFQGAVDDLLAKVRGFPLAKALVVIGNDLLHTDNLKSETTSGTRVDSDSRYHRAFDAATEAMRWAIERAKQVAALVEVVVVPGNHDRVGAFTIGRVLEAMYRNDPRVTFDNTPPLRKYVRFGQTLLGFTHGSEEKHSDLPLIMAQERPHDWAETQYRGWRVGHLHKRRQTRFTAGDSHMGVEVRVVRSLSGTDAWHYSRGYVKERRAVEAFVHHIEDGEVGAFVSRLPSKEAA